MLGSTLLVSSYVVVRDGCPVKFSVDGPDQVQVTCGVIPTDAFEFVMQQEALRDFVTRGAEALRAMDLATQERQ
jgi:hypothetical protein